MQCLTSGRPGAGYRPAILAAPAAAAALAAATHTVLLGLDGGAGILAIDLSRLERAEALGLAGATDAVDVRAMFTALDEQQAATLGYALGILRWHRDQRTGLAVSGRAHDRFPGPRGQRGDLR